jgi:hypothetical protein
MATIKVLRSHVNCPTFVPDFNQVWSFSIDFHDSLQYQISRKTVHWGEEGGLVHGDRWTVCRTGGHDESIRGFPLLCERA